MSKFTESVLTLIGTIAGFFLNAWLLQLVWNWFFNSPVWNLHHYSQAMAVYFITGLLFRRNYNAKS